MGSESKSISTTADSPQPESFVTSSKAFLLNHLPSWVLDNLNTASYKLLARAWLASWAAFLLLLPNRSLDTFGNATFFACISSITVPAALPVQMYFFAMTLMMLGFLCGWAWGCAAMKAALTVRNQVLLLSEIQLAKKTAATASNPDAMFIHEVFQGKFLDTKYLSSKSNIVYGVFHAIGIFFFAAARVYYPRLSLFSIFGTLFLNVICSYGPLFPAANYLILQSFLLSTAAYMAIGCTAITLVFPETLNHQALTGVSKLLTSLRQLVEIQETVLSTSDPQELTSGSKVPTKIQGLTAGVFGGIRKLSASASMLSLEFSFGRLNGEDIRAFIEPLTLLASRIAGLQNFFKLVSDSALDENVNKKAAPSTSSSAQPSISDLDDGADSYVMNELLNGHRQEREMSAQVIGLEQLLPLLRTATAELRSACVNGLQTADTFITRVNTTRWRKSTDPEPDINQQLDVLRRALEDFKQNRRLEVLDPFREISIANRRMLPPRVVLPALVFQANLVWVAEAILAMLEHIAQIADKRAKARLWAPKSLRSIWKVLTMKNDRGESSFDNDPPPVDPVEVERAQMVDKRDPDSRPPANAFQHAGAFLHKCYKWCSTPQAIYMFKYTFVGTALWLPSVFKTSAYFNYVNKGIWALIMSQTTLEPFMADQIYSYVARLTATLGGIVLGLTGWYIGAGNGNGNPYGIAAVIGVLLIPILFWRIFTPSVVPAIMGGVTVVLVMGYSWVDSHLALVGNPGVGWDVGWRRWLLILIGSGASAALMLIPPKSAKSSVRLANASMIFDISQLYSLLVSRWIMVEEETAKGEKEEGQMVQRATQFRSEFTRVVTQLHTLKTRTSLARWEGSLRGAWPVDQYTELNEVEQEMLLYIAQLAGAVYHLDPAWRARLLHRTRFLNPNYISEVMSVFFLVSRSLRTGEPLHATLPKNLFQQAVYHHQRTNAESRKNERDTTTAIEDWEQLRSPEFMAFAAGVTALYKILTLLDRLHAITVDLCGEITLRGFEEWKDIQNTIGNTAT